jgi:hypothetical protein
VGSANGFLREAKRTDKGDVGLSKGAGRSEKQKAAKEKGRSATRTPIGRSTGRSTSEREVLIARGVRRSLGKGKDRGCSAR